MRLSFMGVLCWAAAARATIAAITVYASDSNG